MTDGVGALSDWAGCAVSEAPGCAVSEAHRGAR
jgi:hypothetical protein